MMAELRSDKAVDKGNFNDRRRSALDSFMTDLRRRLCGGLEEFVTHLQGQKVISQSDWQDIERSYKTDKARIFHLLNDVLVYKDGSWREILVFLYNANCSDLAGKLQSAAGESTVNLTSSAGKLTVETSLPTGEPQQLVQSSINVEWRQFVRDVVAFNLGAYRAVESFDIDGDSVPIESVWVDLELEGSERKFFSDYKEIFDHMRETMCRLAIVRGQPGSGKTTLAKKIAYDWGKEKLKGFDLVLAVPLRDVQSKSDLLEMAVRIHVANDDDIKRICADLRREKLKVLIVLDGLDEFQIPPDSPLSKIFGSGLSGVNVVSASLIRFDFDLIVTSRPFACQLIHENIMTVKYDLVGFTEERKLEFVAKRCKTQGGKAKAIEYLNHTNCLKEVAQNPLLLALMCFLCDRGEPIPSTLTQLFATFVRRMLIRAAQKNAAGKDFYPPIWQKSELLKYLSSLALLGVIKCQFLFSWEDMDTCHIGKEHFHSGLIHYRSDPVGFVSKCYFPHRSIQDFLAAFYTVYYWGNKTLSESTGWSTDTWPSNLVDLIPLMKVELLMARLLTTDSQFCHFLFGLASGRTDVSCLSLLRSVLDEIVDFYAISPLDLIVFLGDDIADCSDEEHFAAGRICNEKIDLINGLHLLHSSHLQTKKLFFAKWKGVSRRVRKATASLVLGKLKKQFRSGFKLNRLDNSTISFAVGTDDSHNLKVLCLQLDGENFHSAISHAKQFNHVGCVLLHLASSQLENTSAVLNVLTKFPTIAQLEVHKVGRTQPTVLAVAIDAQSEDVPKHCTLRSIRMYVTAEIVKTVIQDLRTAMDLEPTKIEIVSAAQNGLDQCVVIRVSNDMTNIDLWTFVSGGSWIHDVIESRITTMKSKLILEPYEQVLPEIISRMKTSSTFTLQRECLKLIRSEKFWPQNITELNAQLKEDLVETMLIGLQSNISAALVWEYARTLSDLSVASDPINKYAKTVEIFLRIISNPEMTTKTKRSTVWLLNDILLKSDEYRQNLVVQLGGVEPICELIRQQLSNTTYDRILMYSWICLTNLCCSLESSKKFLSAGGIDLFHLCYEKLSDEAKMVERMIGMMWNLTVFASLRPQLVSKRNFDLFWKILLQSNDNVAISYRCVGTFDNFLSDSTLIWPLDSPTVEETKNLLTETINKWQLDAKTNLNISTFKPRLDPMKFHKFSLADLLVIWTIANLTTVDAPKYCRMLSEAGGVEILTTEVIRHSNSSLDAVVLAKMAIDNVNKWAKSAIQH